MVNLNETTLDKLDNVLSRLRGVKKNSSGHMACCPAHDDKTPSLSITVGTDNILLYCFASCSLENIVSAIGLEVKDLSLSNEQKPLKPNKLTLSEFANKKCLPIELLQKLGVKDSQNGLVFTYRDEHNNYGRSKIRHGQTAQQSCWDSNKDLPIIPYAAFILSFVRTQKEKILNIVEGESDALTLLYYNIPTIGIPGASNTKCLKPQHISEIDCLYLHREADKAGEGFINNLKKKLKEFNYTGKAYVIEFKGNGIKDVNDLHRYCSNNGLDFKSEFQKMIDNAVPIIFETETSFETKVETNFGTSENGTNSLSPGNWVKASDRENYGKVLEVYPSSATAKVYFRNPHTGREATKILPTNELTPINESSVPIQFLSKVKPFKLISAKDLLEQPDPEWLVKNIFTEKSVVFLYGQPGVGKSFIALDLSLSITSGQKWSNKEVKTGSVVYVAAEGSAGIGKRIKAWLEHHKTSIPDNFYFITVPANLMHETVTDSLIASIKEVCPNPKMIVLDTFARSLVGGDENSAKDTGLFIAGVDRLKEETEATILILHHTQKANGNVERGSSAIRGSADTMIIAQAENEHGRMSFSLKCDKQKDAEPFDLMQFHLLPVLDSCVPVSTAFEKKVEKTSDNVILALKILNNFVSTEGTTFSKWQEVAKNKGMSKSSFYRTFKTLIDEVKEGQPKYVRCSNKRYYLTDEGKAFLGLQQNENKELGSSTSSTSSKLVSGTNETSSSTSSTSSKSISLDTLELVGTETETKKETKELKQNIDTDLLDSDPLIAYDANNEITTDKSRSYLLKDDAHKLLGQWLAFQRKLSPLDPTKIDKDIFGKAENLHQEFLRKKSHADTDSVFLPAFEQTKAALENFCKTYIQKEGF
jgi:RecA-family ATPase